MEFNDLVDLVQSNNKLKVYFINMDAASCMDDPKVKNLFSGYVCNLRTVKKRDPALGNPEFGYTQYIDLMPFVALSDVTLDAKILGQNTGECVYNDLVFCGTYATLNYKEHERQVNGFIKQMYKHGEKPERLQEYFRLAKEL